MQYNLDKDAQLRAERGISFEEIIHIIASKNGAYESYTHRNQDKYPNQRIYEIEIDGYIWIVPFIENEEGIFLKTAFPSQKHTKIQKGASDGKTL